MLAGGHVVATDLIELALADILKQEIKDNKLPRKSAARGGRLSGLLTAS